MSEPLARASFEFDLDDLADVSCRFARDLPSQRRLRVQATIFTGVLGGVGMYFLMPFLSKDTIPWWLRAGVSLAVALFSMWRYQKAWEKLVRRRTRRAFRDLYGEGPHRCDVELHAEHFTAKQFLALVTTPWVEVDSVRDDRGNIEIQARKAGSVVVRASAFAGPAERAQFLDTARRLLNEARSAPAN